MLFLPGINRQGGPYATAAQRSFFTPIVSATASGHQPFPAGAGTGHAQSEPARPLDRASAGHLRDIDGLGSVADAQGSFRRRRPGESYEGFIGALASASAALLELVMGALRRSVCEVAMQQRCWESEGFVCFGVDGTKIDCPMTVG